MSTAKLAGETWDVGTTARKVLINLSGRRFGLWTVQNRAPDRCGRTTWNCRCECGIERSVLSCHLVSGKSASCGCINAKATSLRMKTHGCSRRNGGTTSEYRIWCLMKGRCRNSNLPDYANYGGRGITVCDRWESFENFIADMGQRPSRLHSIERINVNGNYEPTNCKWATPIEQARNTRRNVYYEINGLKLTLRQAVEMFGNGQNADTVKWRIYQGQSIKEALRLS